ncbi:MAG: ABC transporter substrate-binding protein [Rhodococcus sp. (in: high G+C Gram-positive bacteria)]
MSKCRSAIPITLAALMLSACGAPAGTDASTDDPVTIDVPVSNATEPYVIPWLVAKEQGFFEARGVIVDNIVPSKGGSSTLRNLLSGDLPIGDVGFTSVLESTAAGAPVTVVGGATQSVYGLDFYASASNDTVNTIADVKKWAYTNPQSVTQALTFLLPEAADIDTVVERTASGGVGEGIALLESGDVDVAVVPTSVVAKGSDEFRLVVSSSDYLKSFQQSVITTTPEYAESHPKVVEAVVGGYHEAVGWIENNPAKAAELYAEYSDIPVDVATTIVEMAVAVDNWGAGFNAPAVETAVRAMQVSGSTVGSDYCALFDGSFLPADASSDLPEDCS